PEMNLYYIGFGCHRPPLDRLEVRRTIARSIQPDRFRKALYGEVAELAEGPVPPGLLGAQASGSSNGGNSDENSREGLDTVHESAHMTIRPIELWYVESDSTTSLAMEAVQADLEAAGIECRLRKTDPTTYGSRRREGRFDLFYANWWADYPDADNFLSPLFLSGSSSNHTRFSDPETDRLILAARREWDPDRRAKLEREVLDRIQSLAPAVFLWHRGSEALTQPWVEGYRPPALFHGTLFLDLRVHGFREGRLE
ncbi:MAG: ABC transporter substrate-binding protein, partial [Candidatus Omnitrophica bacterium]|nr:ABC transporter substrate-binding protein [Candidatus Omnitrophota bacterium]